MIAAGANPLQIAEALGHSDKNRPARPDTGLEAIRPSLSGPDARGPWQHSTATHAPLAG